jgi:hypothetical protein
MGLGASRQQTGLEGIDLVKHRINEIASGYANGTMKDDRSSLLDPNKCDNMVLHGQDMISKLYDQVVIEGKTKTDTYLLSDKDKLGQTKDKSISYNVIQYGTNFINRIPTSANKDQLYIRSEKKQSCVDLAAQYVKLFHLIAAIRYALVDDINIDGFEKLSSDITNPSGYKDYDVGKIKKRVMAKNPSPKLRNMCSNRLKGLLERINSTTDIPIDDLKPNITGKVDDYLPNILSVLYSTSYKDGKFVNPSENNVEELQRSAELFSRTYHGDNYDASNPPKNFDDIKLNNYDSVGLVSDPFPSETIEYKETTRQFGDNQTKTSWNGALQEYAKHLKLAEESHVKSAMELLSIIHLFFDDNKQIKKAMMSKKTVHGALNSARRIIITMEATCEKNLKETLDKYKGLIELKKSLVEQQKADARGVTNDVVDDVVSASESVGPEEQPSETSATSAQPAQPPETSAQPVQPAVPSTQLKNQY